MKIEKIFLFLAFFAATPVLFAQEVEEVVVKSQPEFVWNKWDTSNFIVLSINKSQGLNIKKNVETIKSKVNKKWGIQDKNFDTKCKLLCVTDGQMLVRFFNIEEPKAETRKDSDGKVSLSAIWTDFEKIDNLNHLVAHICLDNSDSKFFIKRGIPRLESRIDKIKSDLLSLSSIDVKKIISTNQEDWVRFSFEEKEKFDKQCALVCLLLRRELGREKFNLFMNSPQDESSLKQIYGFFDINHLSKISNDYCKNLSKDILENKMPDSYLHFK